MELVVSTEYSRNRKEKSSLSELVLNIVGNTIGVIRLLKTIKPGF
uniref:Uncharacterized protein n=1 Tax=Utricularia reniformis TaxID=192314 RepID=A0A1Y0AZL8_9LAMI|nr:hypothetical protein AEK19_MT0353 [Utricularia reniformis]ART30626.1 hypothetical protein AEK19_MT0353 [Utricularia reniformis]